LPSGSLVGPPDRLHYYRNVFSAVPRGKVKEVATMLEAIHEQEDHRAAQERAAQAVGRMEGMNLA
jgi:putative transposase